MKKLMFVLLMAISCVSKAQDSVILKTGTAGYVTLIMGSVSANYQRGYLGTAYYYAGTDSTLAININSGFPKAFISPPKHVSYFCDGDVSGNPKFPSMDSLRKWNNLHLEFTDTSTGGGGIAVGNPVSGGLQYGILVEDASQNLASSTNLTYNGATLAVNGGITATQLQLTGNIIASTSPGMEVCTGTNQPLGFYGKTPIVQPSGDIVAALSNLGLVSTPTITGTILQAQVSLSSAQILALNVNPVTLVPAQGVGTIIVPLQVIYKYTFNTSNYTSTNLYLDESGGSQGSSLGVFKTPNAGVSSGTGIVQMEPDVLGTAANGIYLTNTPLNITAGSNPTLGDGTAKVTVLYQVITP